MKFIQGGTALCTGISPEGKTFWEGGKDGQMNGWMEYIRNYRHKQDYGKTCGRADRPRM